MTVAPVDGEVPLEQLPTWCESEPPSWGKAKGAAAVCLLAVAAFSAVMTFGKKKRSIVPIAGAGPAAAVAVLQVEEPDPVQPPARVPTPPPRPPSPVAIVAPPRAQTSSPRPPSPIAAAEPPRAPTPSPPSTPRIERSLSPIEDAAPPRVQNPPLTEPSSPISSSSSSPAPLSSEESPSPLPRLAPIRVEKPVPGTSVETAQPKKALPVPDCTETEKADVLKLFRTMAKAKHWGNLARLWSMKKKLADVHPFRLLMTATEEKENVQTLFQTGLDLAQDETLKGLAKSMGNPDELEQYVSSFAHHMKKDSEEIMRLIGEKEWRRLVCYLFDIPLPPQEPRSQG